MQAEPSRSVTASTTMSAFQFAVVILCCFINLSDGFDVATLAFAAPHLSREWGITRDVLGLAFSATPIGLVVGAFLIAPTGDRFGRKWLTVGALGLISISLFLTSLSNSITTLMPLRFLTGMGLGTLVVCLNVTVSEFSNDRHRNILLACLHTGFSLGTMTAGAVAALIIEPIGWRSIFVVAGCIALVTFILSIFVLTESPDFLVTRQPKNALERLNAVLRRMKRPPLSALPPLPEATKLGGGVRLLLSADHRSKTSLLWVASITYAIVGYFLLNWKPQILADAGLSTFWMGMSGVVNGAAGITGHMLAGLMARRVGEARLTAILFACLAVSLVVFGFQTGDPRLLLLTGGINSFFSVAAYTGLFLVAIAYYPAEGRNSGLGFSVGFGRLGAIIGPTLGGLLMAAQLGRPTTYVVFALIALIPASAIYFVRRSAPRTPV